AERVVASPKGYYARLGVDPRSATVPSPEQALREMSAEQRAESTRIVDGAWPRFVSGEPEQVKATLEQMLSESGADELMVQNLADGAVDLRRSRARPAGVFGVEPRRAARAAELEGGTFSSLQGGDPFLLRDRPGRGSCTEGAPAQVFTSVWGRPSARIRAGRDDLRRVDALVHVVVVHPDVVEVRGVTKTRGLEQVTRVGPQRRVLADFTDVALEVAVVDRVEAHQGGKEPDVGHGDVVTDQVSAVGEVFFQVVEAGEDLGHGLVVVVL